MPLLRCVEIEAISIADTAKHRTAGIILSNHAVDDLFLEMNLDHTLQFPPGGESIMRIGLIALLGYLIGSLPTSRIVPSRFWLTTAADFAKGVVVFVVSELMLHDPAYVVVIPFIALIFGCRFSVFSRWTGPAAFAPATAFLISFFCSLTAAGIISISTLVILLIVPLALALATRTWEVPALIFSVFAGLITVVEMEFSWSVVTPLAGTGYLAGEAIAGVARRRFFDMSDKAEIKMWRIVARPFALLFVAIDLFTNRKVLLFIIGVLALVFIVTDFVRLVTKVRLSAVFKKKEINRFSSMTLFLVSVFLTFLLFPGVISYVGLICITIGDFFSKLIGMSFGTTRIYKRRTLEGTLGFFSGSMMFNALFSLVLPIPVLYIVIGSIISSLVELFSEAIDDNFTVSIVCGGVLTAIRYFLLT